jgi:hypothetical protein
MGMDGRGNPIPIEALPKGDYTVVSITRRSSQDGMALDLVVQGKGGFIFVSAMREQSGVFKPGDRITIGFAKPYTGVVLSKVTA